MVRCTTLFNPNSAQLFPVQELLFGWNLTRLDLHETCLFLSQLRGSVGAPRGSIATHVMVRRDTPAFVADAPTPDDPDARHERIPPVIHHPHRSNGIDLNDLAEIVAETYPGLRTIFTSHPATYRT